MKKLYVTLSAASTYKKLDLHLTQSDITGILVLFYTTANNGGLSQAPEWQGFVLAVASMASLHQLIVSCPRVLSLWPEQDGL